MDKLQELTCELIAIVRDANDIYHQKREKKEKGDFYKEVKPFADRAQQLSSKWEEAVLERLTQGGFKYIHRPQVIAVVENIELISVQAFFPETSYTRFKNYVESTTFVLNQLLKEIG